jgi:hypothetical protein
VGVCEIVPRRRTLRFDRGRQALSPAQVVLARGLMRRNGSFTALARLDLLRKQAATRAPTLGSRRERTRRFLLARCPAATRGYSGQGAGDRLRLGILPSSKGE